MKKIAGILICIALAFTFAACSWEIPEKVSVKTNADYNFALGNIEKFTITGRIRQTIHRNI